jgi:hypothetical protein
MPKTKPKTKPKTDRRRIRGTTGEFAVYNGAAYIGYFVDTDDGRVRVYDAEGALVGIYNNHSDAARSLPKVEAAS